MKCMRHMKRAVYALFCHVSSCHARHKRTRSGEAATESRGVAATSQVALLIPSAVVIVFVALNISAVIVPCLSLLSSPCLRPVFTQAIQPIPAQHLQPHQLQLKPCLQPHLRKDHTGVSSRLTIRSTALLTLDRGEFSALPISGEISGN